MALSIYATVLKGTMDRSMVAPEDFERSLNDRRISAFSIGPGARRGGGDQGPGARLCWALVGRYGSPWMKSRRFRMILGSSGHHWCLCHDSPLRRVQARVRTSSHATTRRMDAVIVLKGADTIIARPDRCLERHLTRSPRQGTDSFVAAAMTVWRHGAAAIRFESGFLVENLLDLLAGVIQRLHNSR